MAARIVQCPPLTLGTPGWGNARQRDAANLVVERKRGHQPGDVPPGIWLMNATTPVAEAALQNPGSDWHLISVDQFTPDGNADLPRQASAH
jgi:hypothetical protein